LGTSFSLLFLSLAWANFYLLQEPDVVVKIIVTTAEATASIICASLAVVVGRAVVMPDLPSRRASSSDVTGA
jgi:hypothetical protein